MALYVPSLAKEWDYNYLYVMTLQIIEVKMTEISHCAGATLVIHFYYIVLRELSSTSGPTDGSLG